MNRIKKMKTYNIDVSKLCVLNIEQDGTCSKPVKSTKRKPVTVGEMLKEEFPEPMGISNTSFAERISVHRNVIGDLVAEKAELTTPLAIKLAVAFGNSADFWLNIQHAVDL